LASAHKPPRKSFSVEEKSSNIPWLAGSVEFYVCSLSAALGLSADRG
jgi:hypothetical protein